VCQFCENRFSNFCTILLTNKQKTKYNHNLLDGGNNNRHWHLVTLKSNGASRSEFVVYLSSEVIIGFNGHFPYGSGLASFIAAKDDESSGDNWSHKTCKSSSHIINTNKPTPEFLQAGCPSCRPTNSVKALKGKYHISRTCSSQAHLGVF